MSNFPAAGYLSNAGRTEGEMKIALEDWLAATKQMSGAGSTETTLTIVSGTVTPTGGVHSIDTEAGAATDDLNNIAQTNLPDGSTLMIRCLVAARVVVVKYATGGAGQIVTSDSADFTLRSPSSWMLLKRTGTLWQEISRSGDELTQEYSRLDWLNATTLQLRAGKIPMWLIDHWAYRAIPPAGVGITNAGLTANALYYVYALPNVAAVTLELSVTGPTLSEGVAVKTADGSRILVGCIVTDASSQFAYSGTSRLVISWYSRRTRIVTNYTASASTGATSATVIGGGISFLKWDDEDAVISIQGYSANSTATRYTLTELWVLGVSSAAAQFHSAAANYAAPFTVAYPILGSASLTAGFQSGQAYGRVDAGTGTWTGIRETATFRG